MSRSKLLALGALIALFLAGGALAVLPGQHEATACDTATAVASVPDVLYGDGGTRTGTIPGATDTQTKQVCVTATATDSTVTVPGPTTTVTTTVTVSSAPPAYNASLGGDFLGNSLPNQTNLDKYSLIAQGCDQSVPGFVGRKISYTSGAQVWDANCIVASKATARANGWLLHTSTGTEISYLSGGNGLLVNPGNVSFQNDLKNRLLNFFALHPSVSGVYFDNFEMDVRNFGSISYPIYDQSGNLLYSSPADYQNAQISFIANVGAALKAAGYYVGVNAKGFISGDNGSNDGTLTKQWADRYHSYVTATMIEYWQHRSYQYNPDPFWINWQDTAAYLQSLGLGFIPVDYNESAQHVRFYRGCYLLQWNGIDPATNLNGGAQLITPSAGENVWSTELAKNLGLPTGSRTLLVSGLYRRNFEHGYVTVNPTSAAISYGGVSYPALDASIVQT